MQIGCLEKYEGLIIVDLNKEAINKQAENELHHSLCYLALLIGENGEYNAMVHAFLDLKLSTQMQSCIS